MTISDYRHRGDAPAGGYTPTDAERHQLADVQSYLKHHAKTDFRNMPEKTATAVLNRLAPNVRQHIRNNRDFMDFIAEGGRSMPFAPKTTIDRNAADKDSVKVVDKLETEDVTYRLNERMGTPDSSATADTAPDMRETISAAFGDNDHE